MDDKLFSESEQFAFDLTKIGLYIEEISRELRNIVDPTELETKLFVEEISVSSQDLARLAFHYALMWINSKRDSLFQSSRMTKISPLQNLEQISQSTNTRSIPMQFKKSLYDEAPTTWESENLDGRRVRHPESVDKFDPGKIKENQKIQRAFPTLRTDAERSEAVGHPIKPSKLVVIDAETPKSKRTRTCYNECFWNRLGNNKQRIVHGGSLESEDSSRIIELQISSHLATFSETTCASLEIYKSENTNRQPEHKRNIHEQMKDVKLQAIKSCKGIFGNNHEEQHDGLAVKELPQNVGMEAAHALVQLSEQKVGSSKDRFICFSGKSTSNKVLFSNTRSKFNEYGCSRQSLAEIGGLCKPTLTLTTPNSALSSDGKYIDGNYSTKLDSSTMVPIITEDGCMSPYDTTGGTPSVGNLRVENIRESPQELSMSALQLINESIRPATKRNYASCIKSFISWASSIQIDHKKYDPANSSICKLDNSQKNNTPIVEKTFVPEEQSKLS
ncbi:hypothetical protein AYI70_g12145 [Smittium culicis]|uniref:Uncharacterized protein n=1 Tax=Smittium culicis TaxID=133412 RepID=A0A1R1WYP4_9FUNG|nr:hypothetical protein AYI70_g12145 [Smittium culicis]